MIGGGENRTLVLSKRPINVYMLSIFEGESILMKDATLEIDLASMCLECLPLEAGRKDSY